MRKRLMAVLVVVATGVTAPIVYPGQGNAAPVTFTSTTINQVGGNCANVPAPCSWCSPRATAPRART